jgi:uncharacterized membrane protein YdjX (TVP38/TMEM64 family)
MPEETAALAWLRGIGRAALMALVLAGGAFAFAHRGALDAAAIAEALAQYPAAPLAFLLCHVVASLVFFPRTVLAVSAGALWGIAWGTLCAALGSVLGAIAGFLLARIVNRGLVDLENLQRLGPILLRAERGGWRAVAMLRLVPVIPHSLSNYALGLTRLDLGAYALGSLLGQLPMTIACVEFGAAGERIAAGRADWLVPTLIGVIVLALSIIVPRLARRGSRLSG